MGEARLDFQVSALKVKSNHKFILRTYDGIGKFQKKTKGEWYLNGNKLVLTEASGNITVLEKYQDTWYVADKRGIICLARFRQNQTPRQFWADRRKGGC